MVGDILSDLSIDDRIIEVVLDLPLALLVVEECLVTFDEASYLLFLFIYRCSLLFHIITAHLEHFVGIRVHSTSLLVELLQDRVSPVKFTTTPMID